MEEAEHLANVEQLSWCALNKTARHMSELHVCCYFSMSAPSGFLRWLLNGKVPLEVGVQILCVEVKSTSLPGEGRKGQKSSCAEQTVVHCHHESSCRQRVRPRLYNHRSSTVAQAGLWGVLSLSLSLSYPSHTFFLTLLQMDLSVFCSFHWWQTVL